MFCPIYLFEVDISVDKYLLFCLLHVFLMYHTLSLAICMYSWLLSEMCWVCRCLSWPGSLKKRFLISTRFSFLNAGYNNAAICGCCCVVCCNLFLDYSLRCCCLMRRTECNVWPGQTVRYTSAIKATLILSTTHLLLLLPLQEVQVGEDRVPCPLHSLIPSVKLHAISAQGETVNDVGYVVVVDSAVRCSCRLLNLNVILDMKHFPRLHKRGKKKQFSP